MAVLETHFGYYLWRYLPSIPAAVVFALLFAAATGAHSWRMFKTRTWFCIPFTIGGLFEFIGYCARIAAYNHTGKLMPYITQSMFILLPPALFAASIYMTLGRSIRTVRGESCSIIPVKSLTRIFVLGDVFSFMIQGGGAGIMVKGGSQKLGQNIIVGGLLVQVIMFGLFAATAIVFQVKIRRNPTPESYSADIPWKQSLYMLYFVSALIMLRSIFRVVEYSAGQNAYPLNHEWTLYIFDSLPMFTVMVAFFLRYPSKIRPAPPVDSEVVLAENYRTKA